MWSGRMHGGIGGVEGLLNCVPIEVVLQPRWSRMSSGEILDRKETIELLMSLSSI